MLKIKNFKKPTLIAEIGINHNGDLKEAKKLIDLAKKYNFDYVKFQKRDLNIVIPDSHKMIKRETPWGIMTYIDYKKKIEFTQKQYDEINKYCKKVNIKWFASAWDINSQKFLKRYKSKVNKIASAMITNKKFIEFVAKEKKKTFISTGMASLKNVTEAANIFRKYKCPFVLMHCVSTYPCPEEELNLNIIKFYQKKFRCETGYSGHESSVSPTILAWFLGASVIERHITLNRSNWGTDQAASLSEEGLKYLTTTLFKLPACLGNGKKIFTAKEKKLSIKFRYWL